MWTYGTCVSTNSLEHSFCIDLDQIKALITTAMARLLYYKPGALPLCFITILVLIEFTTCQLFSYYCLGPENETATAGYTSNLTTLLDSMASRASDHTFYNESFNGIYSLFLCRSDVSQDVCRLCMSNVTRQVTQACPGDKRAIMWFELCMIRYSDMDFFGQATLEPFYLRWNPQNTTSPPEGDIGTRGFVYSLVEQAIFAVNMSAEGNLDARDGSGRRFGRAQCSRDLNVNSCSTCLRNLLNRTEACCMNRTGWQVLNPSCYLRYDNNPVSDQPPAPPSEKDGVFVVAVLVGFLYQRKRRRFKVEGTRQDILLGRSRSLKSPHLMELGIHLSDDDHDDEMHQFNLATIDAATNNFSEENKLGEGGFGPVYKVERLCVTYVSEQAWMLWHEGRGHELIDPYIADNCPVSEVVRWIHIALLCVQDDPAVRPTMSSVILMLGSKSVSLPQPTTPPYSTARFVSMSDQSSSIGTGSALLASDQSMTSGSSLIERSKQREIQLEP
ncbi:hypothetical protein V6N12_034664 [Hibiscus sabdariffa]|uniref:Gnk2-homologous domain-containing protein n=1 Tax=Hibiscus sabdariffa TaxID=183260 RepID=A0ABR2B948_9ROSI